MGWIHKLLTKFSKMKRTKKNRNEKIQILKGLALATDEYNQLRASINVLSRGILAETELLEIFDKQSIAWKKERFLKLKAAN